MFADDVELPMNKTLGTFKLPPIPKSAVVFAVPTNCVTPETYNLEATTLAA